ncbi:hypothetical protein DOY81_007156, partial [Sarcophaga bullata]
YWCSIIGGLIKNSVGTDNIMKSFLLFSCLLIGTVVLNQLDIANSDCNVCNSGTNTACISGFEFQQCNNDNKPFGTKYACNSGYYCSVLGGCSLDPGAQDCQDCGMCNEDKRFACIGTKTFALCLGRVNYTDITAECSDGLYCNVNSELICVDNMAPTCSYRDDPTTTAAPVTTITPATTTISPAKDPNAFCRLIQEEDRFPVGIDAQTTCRQYVRCTQLAGTWYGPVYNCPGNTYFDSVKKVCVTNLPSLCRGTVAQLKFR